MPAAQKERCDAASFVPRNKYVCGGSFHPSYIMHSEIKCSGKWKIALMDCKGCCSQAKICRSRIISQLLLLLFAIAMQPVFPSFASQVVIDEVAVSKDGNATTFTINFGLPLEYQKHFPRNIGEIVQIQLKLDEETDRELHKEVREGGELLTPEGEKSVLIYVTYEEGVPGGPYLTLRFSHPVRFDVRSGNNRKSVAVIVYDEKQDEKKSGENISPDKQVGKSVD